MSFSDRGMTEDLYPPTNTFVVNVTVGLYPHEKLQLRKFLNLHYVGDVDVNELDENGIFVPKYPDKETEEFKEAVANAESSHTLRVRVTYDAHGKPTLELMDDET